MEELWIEISRPNFKRQVICVLYKPPSCQLSTFMDELSMNIDLLGQINSSSFELTIIGDFNIRGDVGCIAHLVHDL